MTKDFCIAYTKNKGFRVGLLFKIFYSKVSVGNIYIYWCCRTFGSFQSSIYIYFVLKHKGTSAFSFRRNALSALHSASEASIGAARTLRARHRPSVLPHTRPRAQTACQHVLPSAIALKGSSNRQVAVSYQPKVSSIPASQHFQLSEFQALSAFSLKAFKQAKRTQRTKSKRSVRNEILKQKENQQRSCCSLKLKFLSKRSVSKKKLKSEILKARS